LNERAEKLLGYLRAFDDPTLITFTPDDEGMNLLLRYVPAAVFVRDAQSGQVLFMNDQAADILGVSMKEALGKTLADSGTGITPEGKAGLSGAVRGTLRDTAGARVKVLTFTRRVDLRGRTAEIVMIIDATLFRGDGSGEAEAGLAAFRRALAESGTPYVFTEIAGSTIERDLIVLETGGVMPAFLQGKAKPGCSISELFPPVEAARLVESALAMSAESDSRDISLRGGVELRLISGGSHRALMVFPGGREKDSSQDRVQAKTGTLSATIRKTVLSIDPGGDSAAEGMLRMLGFTSVSVDSVASAMILLEETPERFLFVLLEQDNPPEFSNLAAQLQKTGTGLVAVSSGAAAPDTPEGLKFAQVPAPLGINSLASAVSLVC
jgi:PAS domain-containing protein